MLAPAFPYWLPHGLKAGPLENRSVLRTLERRIDLGDPGVWETEALEYPALDGESRGTRVWKSA